MTGSSVRNPSFSVADMVGFVIFERVGKWSSIADCGDGKKKAMRLEDRYWCLFGGGPWLEQVLVCLSDTQTSLLVLR